MKAIRNYLSTLLMTCVLAIVHGPAWAADPVRGAALFANTNGAPLSCGSNASCHSGFPTTKRNKIQNGTNASLISSAITNNTGGMGVLRGYCDSVCAADIAAYIANPAAASAVPAASVSPASLTFAPTVVGVSASTQTATLTNTGTGALTISNIALTAANAADFSLSGTCATGTLAAGASCTLIVGFTPSAAATRTASLTVSHNATGGSSTVALSGTGTPAPTPSISISASLLDFGSVVLNTPSSAQNVTVTNVGTATLTFSSRAISGAQAADFSANAGSCSSTLAAGASCTISVTFTPGALGARNASLSIPSNAANGTASVTLTGSGQPVPAPVSSLNASALSFGTVTVNSPVTQAVTLSNTGNANLIISSTSISGSGAFTIAANTCVGTLAPNSSCSIDVRFQPASATTASGTLTLVDNAAGSPHTVALSGTGTNAPSALPQWVSGLPLSFSTTNVGQVSVAQTSTITNAGNAPFTPTAIALAGASAGDFQRSGTCAVGTPVASAASCTIVVRFAPTQAGSRTAQLSVSTDGGASLSLGLSGQGNVVVSIAGAIAPASIDFGSTDIGATSSARSIQVSNTGTGTLQVAALTLPSAYSVLASSQPGACFAVPFSLLAGQSCSMSLTFSPLTAGQVAGELTLTTNAPTPAIKVALAGVGTAVSVTNVPATTTTPSPSSQSGGGVTSTQGPAISTPGTSTSAASPVNLGAGGCVAGTGQLTDPTLPCLAALALLTICVRRWSNRRNRRSNSTPNAASTHLS